MFIGICWLEPANQFTGLVNRRLPRKHSMVNCPIYIEYSTDSIFLRGLSNSERALSGKEKPLRTLAFLRRLARAATDPSVDHAQARNNPAVALLFFLFFFSFVNIAAAVMWCICVTRSASTVSPGCVSFPRRPVAGTWNGPVPP